jgi:V8-like Glu-specific endopeptidase
MASMSGVLAVLALAPLAAADAAVVVADAVDLQAMTAVRSGSAGAWAYQTRPLIVTQGGGTRQPADHVTPAGTYTGVGDLIIGHGSGSARCTASRIGERTILTAAHCLADDFGNVTASSANVTFTTTAGLETHAIAGISQDSIHPLYTGDHVEGFDVALLELATTPSSAVDTYGLLRDDSADVGAEFQMVGVGRSGTGAVGDTLASGTKRDGRNRFDAAGEVLEIVFGTSELRADSVLMYDFDNGDAANDAFGYFDPALGLGLADTGFADEVNTASGDSGGPNFIGGLIAGVTSFGLRLAYNDGSTSDVDAVLNSSWGEFSAAARVANPTVLAWIDQQMPAPATPLLLLAGLLAAAARRYR